MKTHLHHNGNIKILAWLIILTGGALCLSAQDYEYTIRDERVIIDKYIGSGGTVSIPTRLDGFPVTLIGSGAFAYSSNLTNVTIPDSVTSIKNDAFKYCTNLTNVTIPDSVRRIEWFAFMHCTSLTSVTIPDSVYFIGEWAFGGCSGLTEIQVMEGNSNYSSLDGVLFDEAVETLIQFPGGRAGEYVIPDSVTSIESNAFGECSSLTAVTMSDSVTLIGSNAFNECSSLISVDLSDSITSLGTGAFGGCSSLGSINLPESITSIGQGTFYKCSSLTNINIPKSVTDIGPKAFGACSSLTSINIPNSVTSIRASAFRQCASLIQISVDPGNPEYSSLDGIVFNKNKEALILYPAGLEGGYLIPDSVTTIGAGAFEYCTKLTSVTIPDSVIAIESGGRGVFAGCLGLTQVTLGKGISNIPFYTFSGCISLNSIIIPETVSKIEDEAFTGCENLTSVYFLGEPPEAYCGGVWCPFRYIDHEISMFYIEGTPGWGDSYLGHPTTPFDPDWLWGPYEFLDEGYGSYTNTGDWLGWLEISCSPWVWHEDKGIYFHIEEPVAAAGSGWIYEPNLSGDTIALGLVMAGNTDWAYSFSLQKWMFVVPGGSGWVFLLD